MPPTGNPPATKPPIKTNPEPPTGNCDNKEYKCVDWAKYGYCTNPKEAQYMKDNCCKACKGKDFCHII